MKQKELEAKVLAQEAADPKEKASFNFMAAITICSDLGAPKNKI